MAFGACCPVCGRRAVSGRRALSGYGAGFVG